MWGRNLTLDYALRRKGTEAWSMLTGNEKSTEADKESKVLFQCTVQDPAVWDIAHPHCYELRVRLKRDEEILDSQIQTVGFRTLGFNPDKGFLLNGRKVKLQGVCEHHDLGCREQLTTARP